jgi:hypothetical protein
MAGDGPSRQSGGSWRGNLAPMTTLKIALLAGSLGAAFAVGLAYVWAGIQGTSPTRDEIARHAFIAFVIGTAAIVAMRQRPKS